MNGVPTKIRNKMNMRKLMMLAGTLLLFPMCPDANAQTTMDKVKLVAIKSMKIEREGGELFSSVVVCFRNGEDRDIRLKNADFTVGMQSGGKKTSFGRGTVDEVILTKGKDAEVTVKVRIGPESKDTLDRLFALFNVLGDPAVKRGSIMTLECTADVGLRREEGWVISKGQGIEFTLKPQVQDEVVF